MQKNMPTHRTSGQADLVDGLQELLGAGLPIHQSALDVARNVLVVTILLQLGDSLPGRVDPPKRFVRFVE